MRLRRQVELASAGLATGRVFLMRAKTIVVSTGLALGSLGLHDAGAAEFPVRGVFGDPKNEGCKSVRAEEEGAYVAFNAGGKTGENGEGGCAYDRIERLPDATYRLSGTCASLEGKPARVRSTLVVKDENQVIYGGTRYVRCR